MKKAFAFIVLVCSALSLYSEDMIILRNGEEIKGEVELISNGNIIILANNEKITIPTNQTYLIKNDKRGNTFFTPSGDMRFDSKQGSTKLSTKDIVIYKCEGDEIIASDINVSDNKIEYKPSNKNFLSGITKIFSFEEGGGWVEIPKSDVFLIRYGSGYKEIINNLSGGQNKYSQSDPQSSFQMIHPFVSINTNGGFPYPATIRLSNGYFIEAILYDDIDNYVYYRSKGWQDGPIFRINKDSITEIETKN